MQIIQTKKKLLLLVSFLFLLHSTSYASNCSLNINPVNFGNYNVLSRMNDSTVGNIGIICDTSPVTFSVDISTGASSSFYPRKMFSNDYFLIYNLYLDPTFQQVWGDGVNTNHLSVSNVNCSAANACTYPVYGLIKASDNIHAYAGVYNDTIIVTLNLIS